MARSHPSPSPSPTRQRQSPTRSPRSAVPSEYELDLDALGMNSTSLDHSGFGAEYEQTHDALDSDDVGGPEDFTANMTHWMTADLSQLRNQIKSRKEASPARAQIRHDMRHRETGNDATEEGDKPILEEGSGAGAEGAIGSQSAMVQVNGTADGQRNTRALSESSMENEEKVMSYLDALPDTDLKDALKSTPLPPKSNMLQVPNASPSKAPSHRSSRSLQPTVEDYDTPRKTTQQTVIRHVLEPATEPPTEVTNPDGNPTEEDTSNEELQRQIRELHVKLEQRDLISKTRITELETLLSYMRSELEAQRMSESNLKQHISQLEGQNEQLAQKHEALLASSAEREDAWSAKFQEYAEELNLQNLEKLRKQREEFEIDLREMEDAQKTAIAAVEQQDEQIRQLRSELEGVKESREKALGMVSTSISNPSEEQEKRFRVEREELAQELESTKAQATAERVELNQKLEEARSNAEKERDDFSRKVEELQLRAETLQSELQKATEEAKTTREDAQAAKEEASSLSTAKGPPAGSPSGQLDSHDQFQKITALESSVSALQTTIASLRVDLASKDQDILKRIQETERLEQAHSTSLRRIEGLENTVSTLRQQLSEAHKENARIKTEIQRLEDDLSASTEQLEEARREADSRVSEIQRKLEKTKDAKQELETRIRELKADNEELNEEHEDRVQDIREKAEDAVRKVGGLLEEERAGKRRLVKELNELKSELKELNAKLRQTEEQEAGYDPSDSSDEENEDVLADDEATQDSIQSIHTNRSGSTSSSTTPSQTRIQALAAETLRLRAALKSQLHLTKSLQSSSSALESTNSTLRSHITTLESDILALQTRLREQETDFAAVNREMDRRIAEMLQGVVKERAKGVVKLRDEQWIRNVDGVVQEKEFMKRVLLREWGRGECGPAREREGERQRYGYRFVKRDREGKGKGDKEREKSVES